MGQAKVDLRKAFASPGQLFTGMYPNYEEYANLTIKDKVTGSLQFSFLYSGPPVFNQPSNPGPPQNPGQYQNPGQPKQPQPPQFQQQGGQGGSGFIL